VLKEVLVLERDGGEGAGVMEVMTVVLVVDVVVLEEVVEEEEEEGGGGRSLVEEKTEKRECRKWVVINRA